MDLFLSGLICTGMSCDNTQQSFLYVSLLILLLVVSCLLGVLWSVAVLIPRDECLIPSV